MNYITLFLINEADEVLSLDAKRLVLPNIPVDSAEETATRLVANLLTKIVHLHPNYVRAKFLDIEIRDRGDMNVIYGGLIPKLSPLKDCYWLKNDNPNYTREIINNYA